MGILQKRLILAQKVKKQAVRDSERIQKEIERQNEKLQSLQEAQAKLNGLELFFRKITAENMSLREELNDTAIHLQTVRARNQINSVSIESMSRHQ